MSYENAITEWVKEQRKSNYSFGSLPDNIEKITDIELTTYYGGYCDTCGYETTGLDISYVLSDGSSGVKTIEWSGSLMKLISEIT